MNPANWCPAYIQPRKGAFTALFVPEFQDVPFRDAELMSTVLGVVLAAGEPSLGESTFTGLGFCLEPV